MSHLPEMRGRACRDRRQDGAGRKGQMRPARAMGTNLVSTSLVSSAAGTIAVPLEHGETRV